VCGCWPHPRVFRGIPPAWSAHAIAPASSRQRVQSRVSARSRGSASCWRLAAATMSASRSYPRAGSAVARVAPSATASPPGRPAAPRAAGRRRTAPVYAPRQRLEHQALCRCRRLGRAEADPGNQAGPRPAREQVDHRREPQRPHPEPQPEQRGAAADQHVPACRVRSQPAVRISMQLDRVPPHRNRHGWVLCTDGAGGRRDQEVSLTGRDRHQLKGLVLGHFAHLRTLAVIRSCGQAWQDPAADLP
jgi:hypothetical protein